MKQTFARHNSMPSEVLADHNTAPDVFQFLIGKDTGNLVP
jgi:hypothetical protein